VTLKHKIWQTFGGKAFVRPLFYSYPGGLRFALSETGNSIEQFLLALRKATTICRDIFVAEDSLVISLRAHSGSKPFGHRGVLGSLRSAGIHIPAQRWIWSEEIDRDEWFSEVEPEYWIYLAFEAPVSLLETLLWCALAKDFQAIRPRPPCDFYLFNLKKSILVFPYDDRGMDVVGPNRDTPLDQLICRIDFRKARYEGEFTPPSERLTIQYPSWLGGMNWGSVSIAENLGYMIVNDTRVAIWNRMIPRAAYDEKTLSGGGHEGNAPQVGTPWGIEQGRFLSPLGIPCQEPPYGTISAIDLATRKVAWSTPLGTTEQTGPFGITTHLPMPIGMPTRGGPITTSTGLVLMAGTQDFYIRALDVRTGKELWKGRLPVGAEATPMTYVSPKTGRQFVVISAGGNSAMTQKGDYVIAYALPE
jgi:hypothetical protein